MSRDEFERDILSDDDRMMLKDRGLLVGLSFCLSHEAELAVNQKRSSGTASGSMKMRGMRSWI